MKLKNLLLEAEYTHIGYGKFKEKGHEKDSNAPTFKKDDNGKFVPISAHAVAAKDANVKKDTPKVNIFNKPKEEPKEEPKSQPKKLRQGNPQVNKVVKAKADSLGITPQKLGKEEYQKKMAQAAYEALTDANFHTEARELIAKLEGRPEMAERPEYPSMKDPKYKEKMAALSKKYASEYSDNTDEDARDLGISASQEAGWGGVEAADSIAFTLRMNGFHKLADTIQSVFDNKPYMKEEGRISLSTLVNESSEADEIAKLTGVRNTAIQKFIDDNNIHARKLLAYLKIKGPNTLKNRMDISTAIVGKPNNKFAQGIIKAFQK